jgi:squalene-hopene/tetraprenyl-beta-curcumene cyclase
MLLWASSYLPELTTSENRASWTKELLGSQRPDGGWALADLVDNTGAVTVPTKDLNLLDKSKGYAKDYRLYVSRGATYKSVLASDGYATGFAVFMARRAGVPAKDDHLRRGIDWLRHNQRETGRWFTASIGPPHQRFIISNAGTAFAVMALEACDAR